MERTINIQNDEQTSSATGGGKATMSRTSKMTSLHDLHLPASVGDEMQQPPQHPQPAIASQVVFPPPPRDDDHGIGQGTLLFNTQKLGSGPTASGTDSSSEGYYPSLHHGEERRLIAGLPGPYLQAGVYGAVHRPPPPGDYNIPHQHTHHHQHQFHYSSPDYPQDQHSPFKPHRHYPDHDPSSSSLFGILASCAKKPLHLLCCCCSLEEQQLQRSFCYGAIDGMLTGSGIVAAFCGMDLLSPGSDFNLRLFVVAFSAAACFADSLCMALGHVWTTHVLVSTSAKERTLQRQSMEANKADAKGKLVDMLLARGMLKIDAMSLADTLEGYPDLFVSALVGDALIAGGVSGTGGGYGDSSSDLNGVLARHRSSGGSGSGGNRWGWNAAEDYPRHPSELDPDGGGGGGLFSWKFPSYGERMNELDHDDDPEAFLVGAAMGESRREGFFMLLGFSSFAVVPSLIYLLLPLVIPVHGQVRASARSLASENGGDAILAPIHAPSGAAVSESTLVLITMACIMWCLGVWKSRFLDSNWALFGIETVVVLVVCVAAGYGLGALLVAMFPGIDASTLFIVSHGSLESV